MTQLSLHQLLKQVVEQRGSDLHITCGTSPMMRLHGNLVPMATTALSSTETQTLCYSVLTEQQKNIFEEESELDFSFGIKNVSRFRGNLYIQKGAIGGAFRTIPAEFYSFEELGLPPIANEISRKPRGLVLCTGPTGSGKTTTLAAILNKINMERHSHIVTIEDPIEYLHSHKNCIVNQREIGSDTDSFKKALKHILRQDPDVILIGEMRDLETIEAAITIAETGHLVFSTLHTNSTVQTIHRILDVFPPYQQAQVRSQLSLVLEGVMCQTLIPRADGTGRVLGLEVMMPNPAIRNLIREDKIHQIYGVMQMGQGKTGMQTMNQSLAQLVSQRRITSQEAFSRTSDEEELRSLLSSHNDPMSRGATSRPR